jgi:hypothetical protein
MEMIATSNMYKNVCRSGPDAKGLNVSMRGTLNSTLEVACHGGTNTCPACPACDPCSGPPGDCSGGVAANMFGAADADTDMRLTQVEAERVAKELPVHPHARKSCHGVSLHGRFASCWVVTSGPDVLLTRQEYMHAFVPCLLRGPVIGDACRTKLCIDP